MATGDNQVRLYSNPESAERGEISAFAIVETLTAMGIAVWIAVRYDTAVHIAISGCIAPFLLLRTDVSTKLALSWFEERGVASRILRAFDGFVDRITGGPKTNVVEKAMRFVPVVLMGCLGGVLVAVMFPVARVAATVVALFREPTGALRAVAANWRRIAWATDVCAPPEVLPGIETSTDLSEAADYRFRSVFGVFFSPWNPAHFITRLISFLFLSVGWFLPSIVYRLSLKSTSILYLPFMFVIRSHIGEDLSSGECIRDIKSGATEQLQWWYAWIVIVTNSAALASLAFQIADLNQLIVAGGPIVALLFDLFLPTNGQQLTLKAWHIARVANAVIVIWLYFYADRAARRLESGTWTEDRVKRTFEISRSVQVVLALYTTFCALSRFVQFVWFAKLPPVEFEFVP